MYSNDNTYTEMLTFRNEMRVKCEFSFAEWNDQLRVLRVSISKCSSGWKPLESFHYLGRVLYCNFLLGDQIHDCSRIFLFSKLTYKFSSYASTPDMHPSFLISTKLTTNILPTITLSWAGDWLGKTACMFSLPTAFG